jgi:erythromycin esterase
MISRPDCRRPACLAAILLLACLSAAGAQPLIPRFDAARRPPPPVGDPILPGLWRLHGTDPTLPQKDLEPLIRIVGKAGFVGLGEPIHTSGGFYEAKDRIFRFLVQRLGFRVFGMETPWIRGDQVESFVQTCDGSARDAMRGIFGVWQSTEVEALVQWMCDWNRAHPKDRVHFYGFDIQRQAPENGAALIEFLHRLDVGDGDPRIAGIRVCDGVDDSYYPNRSFPSELYQQCQDALAEVAEFFDREERDIQQRTSKADLAWTRVHLVGLQAWQEQIFFFAADVNHGGRARDRGMAYTVQAIHDLRFARARTVLWAHNGHLAKSVDNAGYIAVQMGTLLAASLGANYVTIGLAAHDTFVDWPAVNACGRANLWVGPGSVELIFHDLAPGAGLLADLNARPPLLSPGTEYSVGSVQMVPVEQFNAILYLEESPRMHPLAWAPCT